LSITAEAHGASADLMPRVSLDDRLVRAVGIPMFGIAVPRISGVLDGLPMSAPVYWVGSALAIAAVAAVCHGTRGAYLAQRHNTDWMERPLRELTRLLAAIVFFTVPPTVLTLAAWYALLGTSAAWRPALITLAVAILGVVLMIYLYELAFLLKERAAGRTRLAGLDRARAEAELAALHAQVDPHFLFNSLNALSHLIVTDPRRASAFTSHLAELHRYVLRSATTKLVSLEEELRFLDDYVALMTIRFATSFEVEVVEAGADRRSLLPPMALQTLVENAIKHNELDAARPLRVTVALWPEAVEVRNPRRPRRRALPSAGAGLRNLDERVQRILGQRIRIAAGGRVFAVSVPLQASTVRVHSLRIPVGQELVSSAASLDPQGR
jgi:hypothetical protein